MSNFDFYYKYIGFWTCIIFIAFGSIAAIAGLVISITNIKFRKLLEFISTTYFFGAIAFSIGSQCYYMLVNEKGSFSTTLFWSIVGMSSLLPILIGISLVTIKSISKYGAIMIGFAGGFSAMNLFHKLIPSEIILLLCSIALGVIIGCMCFVFNESFQIIVVPCTAFNLIQSGLIAILNGMLALLDVSTYVKERTVTITSYTLLAISVILFIAIGFLHYKRYHLERERKELDNKLEVPNKETLLPSKNNNKKDPSSGIQLPEIGITPQISLDGSTLPSTPPLASREKRASPTPHKYIPTPSSMSTSLEYSPISKPLPTPPQKHDIPS